MDDHSLPAKHFLATHDLVTQLPNAQLFADRAKQSFLLAKRHEYPMAILFVKLDNFNDITLNWTETKTDLALRSIATRLAKGLRQSDTVAKHYAMDFAIILSRIATPEDAPKVAKTLLEAVSMPLLLDNQTLQFTASVGLATYPNSADTLETLFDQAELAVREAKEHGGNQIISY